MMAPKQALLILSAFALSSCDNGQAAFCQATKPIILSTEDDVSPATLRDLIANDDARQELCGRFNGHRLFDLGVDKKTP